MRSRPVTSDIPARARHRAPGRRRLAWCSAIVLAGACERKAAPRPPDSVIGSTQSVAVPPTASTPRVSGWNADAGTALLVRGEGGDALVVVPGAPGDSSTDDAAGTVDAVLPGDVALFTRSGAVGHARAELAAPGVPAGGDDCVRWPTARLGPASGADAVPAWTVGFAGGSPVPLALDSLETATPADSAGLAAAVTRLASGLTDDTVRALRGVPFTVRSARRFDLPDGTQAVVGVLTRALNQEASPIGEHILLVAERPAGAAASAWKVAYHEREAGREEDVASTEVLAAVALGAQRRPTLVLARALSDGNRYALLERTAPGAWRVRWTSVVGGC